MHIVDNLNLGVGKFDAKHGKMSSHRVDKHIRNVMQKTIEDHNKVT